MNITLKFNPTDVDRICACTGYEPAQMTRKQHLSRLLVSMVNRAVFETEKRKHIKKQMANFEQQFKTPEITE